MAGAQRKKKYLQKQSEAKKMKRKHFTTFVLFLWWEIEDRRALKLTSWGYHRHFKWKHNDQSLEGLIGWNWNSQLMVFYEEITSNGTLTFRTSKTRESFWGFHLHIFKLYPTESATRSNLAKAPLAVNQT